MKVPATMATQHPDSASRYVPIQEEADEALHCLTPQPHGLGINEIMIDFEGKMTPYHQTAEIAHKLIANGMIPGEDVFITPRISSATEETVFRQLMALMSIIEADYDILRTSKRGSIREIVLPMVRGLSDLTSLRQRIADILDLANKEFGLTKDPNSINIIPLVESVPTMLEFPKFFRNFYATELKRGIKTKQIRYMIGRSDSAMSFGLIPSVLATKLLISSAEKMATDLNIKAAPIFGGGALPFRGHITPNNMDAFISDFKGVRTVTIQSGLRYDNDERDVKHFISDLEEVLPTLKPSLYEDKEERFITNCIGIFAATYLEELSQYVKIVAAISDYLPRQRDRLTRRSAIGYSRETVSSTELITYCNDERVKKLLLSSAEIKHRSLPRAITFTGSFYSIGFPPEFIGLAAGLRKLKRFYGQEGIELLKANYSGLLGDLLAASKFLHLDLAKKFFGERFIKRQNKNLTYVEELLNVSLLQNSDTTYQTLLEITEPLLRVVLQGKELEDEDKTLFNTCMKRLGKIREVLAEKAEKELKS